MNSLLQKIQEQTAPVQQQQQVQQGKEGQQQGKSFDDLMQAWQAAGQPKGTGQLYSMLSKILGNEDQAAAAFEKIGITMKKGGNKAQEVLEPKTAQMIATVAAKLNKSQLEHMIKVVQAGKVLPIQSQQQGSAPAQGQATPPAQQQQQQQQQQQTVAA